MVRRKNLNAPLPFREPARIPIYSVWESRENGRMQKDRLARDRTMLANERTLLAYVRTALTLVITGMSGFYFLGGPKAHVTGLAVTGIGIIVFPVGILRFAKMRRRILGAQEEDASGG